MAEEHEFCLQDAGFPARLIILSITRVDPLTSILATMDPMARFLLRSYQDVSLSQDQIILKFSPDWP